MSNHAPGPWSFDPGFSGKSAFVVDVEGHMIAMLPHADPRGIANAQLVAAAPELLSTAKVALEMLVAANKWPSVQFSLENAIRRAEGDL